jgi:hypothetical protein
MVFTDIINPPYIFYLLFLVVVAWLVLLTIWVSHYVTHYNSLIKLSGKKDLRLILNDILHHMEQNQKNLLDLEKRHSKFEREAVKYLQKVGFLRFNPFSDTGGDQSFILAILDGKSDGLVLSSLHSRGTTRWYAKQIKKGKSEALELSKEEQQVVQKLLKR